MSAPDSADKAEPPLEDKSENQEAVPEGIPLQDIQSSENILQSITVELDVNKTDHEEVSDPTEEANEFTQSNNVDEVWERDVNSEPHERVHGDADQFETPYGSNIFENHATSGRCTLCPWPSKLKQNLYNLTCCKSPAC
ncbi:hypothetical protein HN51_037413 [Arachis hypogaea]